MVISRHYIFQQLGIYLLKILYEIYRNEEQQALQILITKNINFIEWK